jgi:hypothetical protein
VDTDTDFHLAVRDLRTAGCRNGRRAGRKRDAHRPDVRDDLLADADALRKEPPWSALAATALMTKKLPATPRRPIVRWSHDGHVVVDEG